MVRHEHHNSGVFYLLLALLIAAFFCLVFSSPTVQLEVPTKSVMFFRGMFWVLLCAGGIIFTLTSISYLQRMSENLESMVDDLRRMRTSQTHQEALLTDISDNVLLSDTLKSIAFRDKDLKTLEDTAMQSIRKGNSETTEWLIDQVRVKLGAVGLSDKLEKEVDRTRKLSVAEKANEYIRHLESLWSIHDYKMAAIEENGLLGSFPDNAEVQKLRGQTEQKRLAHKRELLEKMQEASRANDHERSVEILKMLDAHLTPTEVAALQETARDVLRTRLHNLGVQFSLAVTAKDWSKALTIGRSIVKDYPNSRMAQEVREKMPDLENLAKGIDPGMPVS